MSIHLGEFLNKLKVTTDPDERRKLYFKHNSPILIKFYELVCKNKPFRDAVKNRPCLYEDYPYGCTRTNLYRELHRVQYFLTQGPGVHIPDEKLVEMWDKLLLSLHQDESRVLTQLANGTFSLPNSFVGEVEWAVQHLRFKL